MLHGLLAPSWLRVEPHQLMHAPRRRLWRPPGTPQGARRAWPEAACRWASGKRQIIERVISQLKDFFALERHRAKTMSGLLGRLAAKIAPYTCGLCLNAQLGRPLCYLADLLV